MPQGAANQRCVAIVCLVGPLCSGVKTERMGELTGEAGPVGDHTFEIHFLDPGVQAFAFTFG